MRRILWVLALVGALGCGSSHTGDGDGGADAGVADGAVRDGGGGGPVCGPTTCATGEVCCNASCGICTAPGGACIDLACLDAGPPGDCGGETCGASQLCCDGCGGERFCSDGASCPDLSCPPSCTSNAECGATEYCDFPRQTCGGTGLCEPRPEGCPEDCPGVCGCDGRDYCNTCGAASAGVDIASTRACETAPADCDAMDAEASGFCEVFLGYKWNGRACEGLSCMCTGADCGGLFLELDECEAAYAGCSGSGTSCGGLGGGACSDAEYCDFSADAMCGFADASGLCRARPGVCTDELDPVCGCNGVEYSNPCTAYAAGTDVLRRGGCGADG